MNCKLFKKNAFTLAEVLITLAIIGVVAAMTIPSLVNNTNDSELTAKWKKAYATLSQAYLMVRQEEGGTLAGVTSDINVMKSKFAAKLQVVTNCDSGSVCGNCWHNSWKYYDNTQGTCTTGWNNYMSGMVLSDGTFVLFEDNALEDGEVIIVIDVNGFKGPNLVSKDIFQIETGPTKVVPHGANALEECNTLERGWACSAVKLLQ